MADRFEVVGTLGRGGTATVYLAHDHVRDQRVAVKVLHDHLAQDPAMRRRLQREVVAAGLVRSEGALVAHDLHAVGDTLALSMPFHPGTTLTERVKAGGPLPADEVRALGVRLADALAEAHRRGVLHRDVTPNNVMLTASADDAVLTDFGLARIQESATATATSVLGTPGYAAPEIYQGQRTDPRSDLYSLGAVLSFAATGKSPWGAGNPAAILHAQLVGEPEPLGQARPDLPPDLAKTIDSLLSKNPERRPPSAREVAEALQARQDAIVPVVPDTWDPAEPWGAAPAQAPAPLVPVDPPAGTWEVVLHGRKGCDAALLADHVGRVLELPPRALEVTRAMRTRRKKFRLMRPTDRATAERLAEAAQLAGYQASLFDVSPPNPLQRLASIVGPLLVVSIWLAFPFFTLNAMSVGMAIFTSIAATVLIGAVISAVAKNKAPADLPLALSSDLSRHIASGSASDVGASVASFIDNLGLPDFLSEIAHGIAGGITSDEEGRKFVEGVQRRFGGTSEAPPASPSPVTPPATPPPAPRQSRAEGLRGRALGNLDLLSAVIRERGDTLPDIARADLERTVAALRARAEELASAALGLEALLAASPETPDAGWAQARLTRLETMERAGEAIDPAERDKLVAVVRGADAVATTRDELESRLTATLAQLLEIGAVATRAHADLLTGSDVPATATLLVGRLKRQVGSVDATRRELDQQRRRQAAGPERR